MPAPLRSIGQVLNVLKVEFPDVSISKIRFLESEGLLSPERAPSGYRRYSDSDVSRLRYILRAQRDNYLPLRVIREHLDMMDRGETPPSTETPVPPAVEAQSAAAAARPLSQIRKRQMHLSRRELLQASGISEAGLIELERHLLVQPRRGGLHYGRESLTLCVVARKLALYGMDVRHLRAIKQSAEREAGLVEQAVQPSLRRGDASETAAEVTQLVIHAHAALMHTLLER